MLAGPELVSRGFVYISLVSCQERHITDWNRIKNIIRDDLNDFLWRRMKRSPVILPIIMEA